MSTNNINTINNNVMNATKSMQNPYQNIIINQYHQ